MLLWRGKSLVLLVVDDQAGIRYLLDMVAKEEGYRVHTAQNGLEAVETAKSVRPDLIFMDVRMPVMDGLEALEKIRAILPEVAVVMMTAYGSQETSRQAYQKGALFCIDKPFDISKVKFFLQEFNWKRPDQKVKLDNVFAL
ncbi:MAG: response regulator [Peptococcaceae bacterium]|nr:MAG: response regulator [Peptococcaceae bacterium]